MYKLAICHVAITLAHLRRYKGSDLVSGTQEVYPAEATCELKLEVEEGGNGVK